ncbi:hypothetical protein [Streptomyces yaizuensis]|uniref:Uncharacterized protein n=1 Tax=Streptomyces yaizuensis TaxID=2989713 RepID=A0ABQ5P2I8_9ACTN|nr:hypothetical protein [Streptomyces sp. YSPA8]GLF96814.1 hypothetical protein SYYSPA8_20975 [Streptomyces sp. YSPA8]
MSKPIKGGAFLATGLLLLSGGMALLGPAASAAPMASTAPVVPTTATTPPGAAGTCRTTGWEWIQGNLVYATCLRTNVNIRVLCSNGVTYQSNPVWKYENNQVSCPGGTNVQTYTTAYR